MNIGIIKNNICIDGAVFDDLQTAQARFASGVWPDADDIAEIPDGYGIGDNYISGEWAKREIEPLELREIPPPMPPDPATERLNEIEDAIIELASIIAGGA